MHDLLDRRRQPAGVGSSTQGADAHDEGRGCGRTGAQTPGPSEWDHGGRGCGRGRLLAGRRPGRGDSDRLVLIGVGVSAAAAALTTVVIVLTDPWNVGKALTWLSGSTYGRTFPQVAPVAVTLALAGPALWQAHRALDLLAVDEDTARVVGVPVDRARPVLLGVACLLTATAVCAVGVIAFVGLVAPHAARVLVGAQHRRVLPVAALLGALLVSVADTLGRTVIAPGQLPAGLLAALVGTPYFVWLLWRSRI